MSLLRGTRNTLAIECGAPEAALVPPLATQGGWRKLAGSAGDRRGGVHRVFARVADGAAVREPKVSKSEPAPKDDLPGRPVRQMADRPRSRSGRRSAQSARHLPRSGQGAADHPESARPERRHRRVARSRGAGCHEHASKALARRLFHVRSARASRRREGRVPLSREAVA